MINRRDAEAESIFRKIVNGCEPPVHFLGVFASLRFILLIVLLATSCSVPNLEEPDCDQARDQVREFYSLHFGNDMAFTADNLEKRKGYLTTGFYESLKNAPPTFDPFTRTTDLPKAFRAGECTVIEPGKKVTFEILLFWKTDTRTEQRAIHVTAESGDGKWRIASVDD